MLIGSTARVFKVSGSYDGDVVVICINIVCTGRGVAIYLCNG